jgi:ACR3 family arsenite efflux pump ArsB
MEKVAGLVLFIAAIAGFMQYVHFSMQMKAPNTIRLTHIVSLIIGILLMIIYAWTTGKHEKHFDVLIMLGIALIPGSLLLWGKLAKGAKIALSIVYGLTGMFALWWLLTFIIPQ